MLSIKGLSKKFGEKEVLKDINLDLKEGEIVGLLGKNGAGKTTLLKSINQLYSYSGSITINNKNFKNDPKGYLNDVGILLEPSYCEYLTALDNMKIICSFNKDSNPKEKALELLSFIGLEDAANKKVSDFSFGMKQRLGVAMALAHDPALLILDEPTIGVDPKGLEILKNKLKYLAKTKNKTILFSSNDLDEMQKISDRIILLKDGKIFEDRSRESIIEEGNEYLITFRSSIKEFINELKVNKNCDEVEVIENNIIKVNNKNLNSILFKVLSQKFEIIDIQRSNSILREFYN